MSNDSKEKKVSVDTGLKVALKTIGHQDVPDEVSEEEYEQLSQQVSQGVRLRMEQKAKEQNMIMLWKGRVNLLKQGRQLMQQKAFSEAAVCFEKYLRVLELVYHLEKGELSPDIFNKSSKSKELTVITSVYWDLVRIYDTSKSYHDRMNKAATKLALFLPYSTLFPHVVKRAQSFQRSAKNPVIIKKLLRDLKASRSGCFIATAVYEDYYHEDVQKLRTFRDNTLNKTFYGRSAVQLYYRFSPPLARHIQKNLWLKRKLRPLIAFFAQRL